MAYTILNTDGTTLVLLADGQIDQSTTSISLIGRNRDSYGESLNNNLVKMLANFASVTGSPPRSPLRGQLWYDTSIRRLKVYDDGFKVVGSVEISDSQSPSLLPGDFWFDSVNGQLKMYIQGETRVIGPSYPSTIGETGFVLPSSSPTGSYTPVKEAVTLDSKNVLVLKSYGSVIALTYSSPTGSSFEMDTTDAAVYMPDTPSKTVVSGVTVVGDMKVHGQLTNDYLSTTLDISDLASVYSGIGNSGSNPTQIDQQNVKICEILTVLFPPAATTATSTSTVISGLLPNTQARVLCRYHVPTEGYQIRAYYVTNAHTWAAWNFTSGLRNVIGI
jgi:hypothetical protein